MEVKVVVSQKEADVQELNKLYEQIRIIAKRYGFNPSKINSSLDELKMAIV